MILLTSILWRKLVEQRFRSPFPAPNTSGIAFHFIKIMETWLVGVFAIVCLTHAEPLRVLPCGNWSGLTEIRTAGSQFQTLMVAIYCASVAFVWMR